MSASRSLVTIETALPAPGALPVLSPAAVTLAGKAISPRTARL